MTGTDGSVNLVRLDPATNYTVEVTAPGYSNFSTSNVAVVSGKNLSVGDRLGGAALASIASIASSSEAGSPGNHGLWWAKSSATRRA